MFCVCVCVCVCVLLMLIVGFGSSIPRSLSCRSPALQVCAQNICISGQTFVGLQRISSGGLQHNMDYKDFATLSTQLRTNKQERRVTRTNETHTKTNSNRMQSCGTGVWTSTNNQLADYERR